MTEFLSSDIILASCSKSEHDDRKTTNERLLKVMRVMTRALRSTQLEPAFRRYEPYIAVALQGNYIIEPRTEPLTRTMRGVAPHTFDCGLRDALLGFYHQNYPSVLIPKNSKWYYVKPKKIGNDQVLVYVEDNNIDYVELMPDKVQELLKQYREQQRVAMASEALAQPIAGSVDIRPPSLGSQGRAVSPKLGPGSKASPVSAVDQAAVLALFDTIKGKNDQFTSVYISYANDVEKDWVMEYDGAQLEGSEHPIMLDLVENSNLIRARG